MFQGLKKCEAFSSPKWPIWTILSSLVTFFRSNDISKIKVEFCPYLQMSLNSIVGLLGTFAIRSPKSCVSNTEEDPIV